MSPAFIEAVLDGRREEAAELARVELPDGWPAEADLGFLGLRLRQMREDPAVQEWLVRAVTLRRAGRPMVGHAGFHGPPGTNATGRADAVELGYTVFPDHRGRGYATEVAEALMDWATTEHDIRRFIASVAPENAPSLAIVRKLGFEQTGEQWDELDGLELVFELEQQHY
jgi:[ribosomal protein S5]-alanine N-acetyltransferase